MNEPDEDQIECPDCEGHGEIETTSPSQCSASRDECCGGCYGEVECETCNGTGLIDKDDE
jgi:DnaJ-class molecular chaperone